MNMPIYTACYCGALVYSSVGKLSSHSFFENSINLILSNDDLQSLPVLITLSFASSNKNIDLHGHMIVLNQADFFEIKQQLRQDKSITNITLNRSALSFPFGTIDLNNARKWYPNALQSQKLSDKQCNFITQLLHQKIQTLNNDMWLLSYQKIKQLFEFYLKTHDMINLVKMLGLGIGLTPSGDDFLIGLYAATCIKKSLPIDMQLLLKKSAAATTSISQHFLQSAAHGFFSESLLAFNQLDLNSNEEQIKKSLENVLQKGASSGLDTMLGYMSGLIC
ncbi:hypothetical protein AwWohl_07560 [Gammaproteobacteria bacterium]|nr:hypothetical protein AwWohl_07560 [Gammaproteobacteria bacterium]